jgi:hypothetical protein
MDPGVWMLALRLAWGVEAGLPRYREQVEVRGYRDPNEALAAYLAERDLTRGPSGGVPSVQETTPYRPHVSPSVDLLGLLKYLAERLGGDRTARFYVYELRAGGQAMALMREAPIPLAASLAFPGITVRLVGEYADRKDAVRAFREAESAAQGARGPAAR